METQRTRHNTAFETLMNCVPSNKANFEYLLRLMHKHVVVPFIGAGVSKNFGYPLWADFLNEQAEIHGLQSVSTAVKEKKYEKAATLLEEQLGGNLESTLVCTFGEHIYQMKGDSAGLEALPKLFQNLILTTNFDETIEMLYAKENGEHIEKITPRALRDLKLSHKRIACGDATLIKLHGDVAQREFVLTEQAYNAVYGKHVLDARLPLPSFLRDVLLSRIILFLGCSLEEDRTLQVIEQSQIDGSISFALLELPESSVNNGGDPWKPILTHDNAGGDKDRAYYTERVAFLSERNIIPIWFPYRQYEALKIFLNELSNRINTEYTFSITQAQNRVKQLLKQGDEFGLEVKSGQAVHFYTSAFEIIKSNTSAFVGEIRLDYLKRIKTFYDLNGYAFECREVFKEMIDLLQRMYGQNSVELALVYHDLGYAYERYQYYTLMLKAMLRSQEILQACRKDENDTFFLHAASYIYISLAYAYLKKPDAESAKVWYKKAEEFLHEHQGRLQKYDESFLRNGLYRYYSMDGVNERDKAIDTLKDALELRKQVYSEYSHTNENANKIRDVLNHICNTHSNLIRMYTATNQYNNAKQEYLSFREENKDTIWQNKEYLRDAKRRILTDHGDLLMQDELFFEAYNSYKEAVTYRKYLHFTDDYLAGTIYLKIVQSLQKWILKEPRMDFRHEEAIEYYVQGYLLSELMLSKDPQEMEKLDDFGQHLCTTLMIGREKLDQRVSVQRDFLNYRHDERADSQENELIKYFDLE